MSLNSSANADGGGNIAIFDENAGEDVELLLILTEARLLFDAGNKIRFFLSDILMIKLMITTLL